MDYGLEQLINDTNNPVSALRGHSLKRDMYGNDSTTYGNGSTKFQYIGNYLAQLPFLGNFPTLNYQPLTFQAAQYYNGSSPAFLQQYQQIPDPNNGSNHFAYHYVQYRTNIPIGNQANGATYGLQFGRAPSSTTTTSSPYSGWMLRLAPVAPNASGSGLYQFGGVAQTFEVLEDDFTGQLAFADRPEHRPRDARPDPLDARCAAGHGVGGHARAPARDDHDGQQPPGRHGPPRRAADAGGRRSSTRLSAWSTRRGRSCSMAGSRTHSTARA